MFRRNAMSEEARKEHLRKFQEKRKRLRDEAAKREKLLTDAQADELVIYAGWIIAALGG